MDTRGILDRILHSEYHLIPYRNNYILYGRSGKVLLLNAGAAQVLLWVNENKSVEGIPEKLLDGFYRALADCVCAANPEPRSGAWLPTALTVSLTNGCNLRCRYCYASAGAAVMQHLDPQIFQSAVELIAKNARMHGKKNFHVNFLGNGESTFNWGLLQKCLMILNEHKVNEVQPVTHLTTNGVVRVDRLQYACKHVHSVTLSVDGLERHQTRLRPMLSGKSSWAHVLRSADTLFTLGAKWELRMTITDFNVRDLAEIVEFYSTRFSGVPIRFEPMHHCGRSIGSDVYAPSVRDFLENYFAAQTIADSKNTRVTYSGVREIASPTATAFCGIASPNFCLKEDGKVVACFSGMDNLLNFGEFSSTSQQFIFHQAKMNELMKLNLAYAEKCRHCFAKYHCLGDCPSLRIANPNKDIVTQYAQGVGRCAINQALVKKIIFSSLGITPTIEDLLQKGGETHDKRTVEKR